MPGLRQWSWPSLHTEIRFDIVDGSESGYEFFHTSLVLRFLHCHGIYPCFSTLRSTCCVILKQWHNLNFVSPKMTCFRKTTHRGSIKKQQFVNQITRNNLTYGGYCLNFHHDLYVLFFLDKEYHQNISMSYRFHWGSKFSSADAKMPKHMKHLKARTAQGVYA